MTDRFVDIIMGILVGFNVGMGVATWIFYAKIKAALFDFYNREKAMIDKMAAQNTPQPAAPPTATPAPDDIQQRLNRASELTRIQNEIVAQAQQPSQNAMHSKHKNSLIQQYKALEAEKMGLLQSILKEGHDPLVTVYNAAAKQNEEVKLSMFLNQFVPATPPAANTEPNMVTEGEGIRKVDKYGKTFYVIDGGKKTTQ